MIGNVVWGMNSCFYIDQTLNPPSESISDKVCGAFMPFGTTEGNVFHSCSTFGWYLVNHFPRSVTQYPETQSDGRGGYVDDFDSCRAFNSQGESQGEPALIENHVDYDIRAFGAGGYEYGDISFVNSRIEGRTGLYGKTYYRSPNNPHPFFDGCEIVSMHYANVGLNLPGGEALIEFR